MAKTVKESQGQLLERVRDELGMSKVDFCEILGVSRPWYDKFLEGQQIDLKHLSFWAVDHAGESIGEMANELIRRTWGDAYLPIGSQDELQGLAKHLSDASYEDLCSMPVMPGHVLLWAAELRKRQDAQLKAQVAKMKREISGQLSAVSGEVAA
jgi:transcriptional regulator with XRE-family HTH domain